MEAPNSSSSVDEQFLVNGDWESMKFGGSIDRLPSLSHFGSESLSEIMNSFGLPENAHGGNDVCARILPSSVEHGREINFKGKKRKKFEECSGLQADSTLTSTHRILNVQYSIPDYVHVSEECQHLISRIFVSDPATRISVLEIQNHPWFLKNLPSDLREANMMSSEYEEPEQPMQSKDEIMQIITEATIPAFGMRGINQYFDNGLDIDDDMDDLESDSDLDDSSGEIVNVE